MPMAATEKNTRDGFSIIYPTNPSMFYHPGEASAKGGKRVAWGGNRLFCCLQDITFHPLLPLFFASSTPLAGLQSQADYYPGHEYKLT